MSEQVIGRRALFDRLPAERTVDLLPAIRALRDTIGRKVLVLDDDPTGTQTVHGIPVVTTWSRDDLIAELQDSAPACYVLTNSRSLEERRAVALNKEIAAHLRQAAAETGKDFVLVSRSDSTLRGHYPAETDTLAATLDQRFDACVLCPFFMEGGRVTIDDLHYVAEGDQLVPAALTPFAADPVFGYRSSNLREWVLEKTNGRVTADQVVSLSIEQLRTEEMPALTDWLCRLPSRAVCIVNAAAVSDMQVAALALMHAEASGKRFLYRTAASFVAARIGIEPRALLTASELDSGLGRGILYVIGSHVPRTTAQLNCLRPHLGDRQYELDVASLLDQARRDQRMAEIAGRVSNDLSHDRAVAIFTSRKVISPGGSESLDVGRQVSRALVSIVAQLRQRPRVLVAKGGITSSDMATDACRVQRAIVAGQILPGVPVWRCGADSRFPGMPLVIFPGNVGSDEALVDVLKTLEAIKQR